MRNGYNPTKGLTPERLVSVLDQFDAGNIREAARLMDQIELRDDKLMVVAPKRKKAVARYGFTVLTVAFDAKNRKLKRLADQQVEALNYFYNNLTATSVMEQDEKGGFSLLVRQMMDCVGKRYSVHEIVWQKRGKFYTAEFWHCPLSFFEATTGKLRFIQDALGTTGVDMEDGHWLVSVGDGIMLACLICWFFKNKPRNAWLRFCEKFGMPGVHGETDAAPGSKEWKQMVSAVSNFLNDWAMVTSSGQKINLIEAKGGTGNLPHPALVEEANRAMVMLWRGADLGTMAKAGDSVGASTQGDETDILETDDAKHMSETLNIKVDRPLIDYLFGTDAPSLAYVQIRTKDRTNIKQELEIDKFAHEVGFPLSKKAFSERYGRAIPDPDDEILGAAKKEKPDPEETKEEKAANEAVSKVAKILGAPEGWMTGISDLVAEMEAKFSDDSASDQELLAFLIACQKRVPELLGDHDVEALATLFEAAMGKAAFQGLREGLQKQPIKPQTR